MRALVNVPTNSSLTQAIERAVRAQEMGKAFQSKPRAAMIRMARPDESKMKSRNRISRSRGDG